MEKLLITNGTLVTAVETFKADLLIEGEKVTAVGPALQVGDARRVDASGMLVLPGGIDPHTHLSLPMFDTISSDDHYTGGKAAALGGTTMVMDFVPQDFPSLRASVDAWHAKADPLASVDFSFHMNITCLTEDVAAQIPALLEEGIPTLKVFMAYNGRLRLQDGEIFQVLRIAREHGMLTMLHAENGDVIEILVAEALAAGHTAPEWHPRTRPAWGAVEAFLRGAALADQAGAPLYVVHMNTAGEVEQLRYARDKGVRVMGETCPQYLLLTGDLLTRTDGARWVCSPPLRTAADNAGLWEGLEQGVIQTVGTDHCPFFYDGSRPIEYEGHEVRIPGKELGSKDFTKIPNGLPGVGDRLPVLWTFGVGAGRLTPNQFVALTSTNPARIFGLYPRKGVLAPGSDADIAIWDPEKEVRYGAALSGHRTDHNLYEGWKLKGFPVQVFLRGSQVVENGSWVGRPGMGRFVPRAAGFEGFNWPGLRWALYHSINIRGPG